MIGFAKRLGLRSKLLLPNLLYVVMLTGGVYFFFGLQGLIGDLAQKQDASRENVMRIRAASQGVKDYLQGQAEFGEVQKKITALGSSSQGQTPSAGFLQMGDGLERVENLRAENRRIEEEIMTLADASSHNSNDYIEQVSTKLADEKDRSEVSTLERLVLVGANRNTSSNYEVKVRFLQLKENLGAKGELLAYLDKLVQNAKQDQKRLEGTSFEGLAQAANASNSRIKSLTLEYVSNVERADALRHRVVNGIEESLAGLEEQASQDQQGFLARIGTYVQSLMALLIVVAALGIVTSVLVSGAVSRILKRTNERVSRASGQLASSSSAVSASSQSLAEAASEQSAALEETSSFMEEMASMTAGNAEHADQADGHMKQATEVVERAHGSMAELTTSISEISRASEETSRIIKTIDEIAFQTNLLALNAAVEAARAGDAGAGFAVVADEVRGLAMRSAEAAGNTTGLIETTIQKVKSGSQIVTDTGRMFDEVTEKVSEVSALISQIATASKEQAAGIAQVTEAMGAMDQNVQGVAATAEESASASQEMSAQVRELQRVLVELSDLVGGQARAGHEEGEHAREVLPLYGGGEAVHARDGRRQAA